LLRTLLTRLAHRRARLRTEEAATRARPAAEQRQLQSPSTTTAPQPDQPDQPERWDYFIAYGSADWRLADRIYAGLSTIGRPFLDRRCLRPGDNWAQRVPAAQDNAKSTVLVITAATPSAWYTESEYLRAIELHRRGRHSVIPVLYGDDAKLPYGLEQLNPVRLAGPSDIDALPDVLRRVPDPPGDPLPPLADASRTVPGAGGPGAAAPHRSGRARWYRRAVIAVVALAVLLLAVTVLARVGRPSHPAASPARSPTGTRAAAPWTGPVQVGESGLTPTDHRPGPPPFDHGDLIYLNNSQLTAPLGIRRWERPGAPGHAGCSTALANAAAVEDSPTTAATYCLRTSRGGIGYLTVTAVQWRSLTGQLLVWPPS
jgi:hypothetical protein